MSSAGLPGATYNEAPVDVPLEAQPVSTVRGAIANTAASFNSALGVGLEREAIGSVFGNQEKVPYAQVKAAFESQKLDPKEIPTPDADGNVQTGSSMAIYNNQLSIQKERDAATRARQGAAMSGVTGFVGGMADPLVLGTGLVGGRLLGAAKAGLGIAEGAPLAGRLATGAVEGAVGVGGYAKGQQQFGTAQGDRDITSAEIFKQAMWGGVLGAGLGGAVGARPTEVNLEPYRQMIVGAENSAGYAKAHGIPVDEVTSKAGAIGLYQITPDTAKSLGFSGDPAMLKDPAYNHTVAMANLEKLHKTFGDDPQAIAIAWNGGPGLARRFIRNGRDVTKLPQETQDYLARIQKINGVPAVAPPAAPTIEPTNVPAPVQTAEAAVATRKSDLVPARVMPDGSIKYGTPNDIHANLYDDDELEQLSIGSVGMEDKTMGFAKPGGPFMSRAEAAEYVGLPGKLESEKYRMSQAGEALPTSFGRRGIPDDTDVAAAKMAIEQHNADSEVNVAPIVRQSLIEKAGGTADPNELAKALPVKNSTFTTPNKNSLEALNEKMKTPEVQPAIIPGQPHPAVAQLQALAKQDIADAEKLHFANTGIKPGEEGSLKDMIAAEHEELAKEDGKPELAKAIDAGVRCAIQQGAA